ncbi:afh1, related [Neospora caninum Liverpool]|uniref:Afh1, related n=1 Tax=Neospora caninum (strain Liverpool) TaxID=572307 RepID=F0VAY8_NEOCL|nr:afh1, related [Neospora caninum Liverpool]CBZ51364.1 afh1, related [Neospora caninum Liverpool]CEL68683.1 TPA: AFH1, related [Neospora caninum Liverpool]|eukprot:XP_003881397.1 afh1, related [Neospora caninum Liverpool]
MEEFRRKTRSPRRAELFGQRPILASRNASPLPSVSVACAMHTAMPPLTGCLSVPAASASAGLASSESPCKQSGSGFPSPPSTLKDGLLTPYLRARPLSAPVLPSSPPFSPAETSAAEGDDCACLLHALADVEARRCVPSFFDAPSVFALPPSRHSRPDVSPGREGSIRSADGDAEQRVCGSSGSALFPAPRGRDSDASRPPRATPVAAASLCRRGETAEARDASQTAALTVEQLGEHSDGAGVSWGLAAHPACPPSAVPLSHPRRPLFSEFPSPSETRIEDTGARNPILEDGQPRACPDRDAPSPHRSGIQTAVASLAARATGASPSREGRAPASTPVPSTAPVDLEHANAAPQFVPHLVSAPFLPANDEAGSCQEDPRRPPRDADPPSFAPSPVPGADVASVRRRSSAAEPGGENSAVPTAVSGSGATPAVESRSRPLRFNPRTGKFEAPLARDVEARHGNASPSLSHEELRSRESASSQDPTPVERRAVGGGSLRRAETVSGPLGGKAMSTFPPRQSTLYALHTPQPPSPPAVSPPGGRQARAASLESGRPHPQWQLPGARASPSGPQLRLGKAGREEVDLHASATPLCVSPQPVLTQTCAARLGGAVGSGEEATGGSPTPGTDCCPASGGARRGAREGGDRGRLGSGRWDSDSAHGDPVSIPTAAKRGPGVLYDSVEETLAEVEGMLKRTEASRRSLTRAWPPRGSSDRASEATNSVAQEARLPALETRAPSGALSSARRAGAAAVPRLPLGSADASAADVFPSTQSSKALAARTLGLGSPTCGLQAVSPPPPACGPVPPSPLVQTCLVAERLVAMRTPWRLPTTSILKRNNIMDIVLYLATLQNLFRGPGPRHEELMDRVERRKRMGRLMAKLREEYAAQDVSASVAGPDRQRALPEPVAAAQPSGKGGDAASREQNETAEGERDDGQATKAAGEFDFLTAVLDQEDVEMARTELVRRQQRQFEPVDLPLLTDSPYVLPSQQQQLVRRILQMTPSPTSGCSGLVEFNILYAYIRRKRGCSLVDFYARMSKDGSGMDNALLHDSEDDQPLGASMQFLLSQLDDTPQRRTHGRAEGFGTLWGEDTARARPPVGADRRALGSSSSSSLSDEPGGSRTGATMSPTEVEAALQLVTRAVQVADLTAGDKVMPGEAQGPQGACGDVSWDQSVKTVSEATAGLMNLLEEETQGFHAAWTGGEKTASRREDGNALGLADVLSVLYPSPPVFIIWDVVPPAAAFSPHAGGALGAQPPHRGASLPSVSSDTPSAGSYSSRVGGASSGSVSGVSWAASSAGGTAARAPRLAEASSGAAVPGDVPGAPHLRSECGSSHALGPGDTPSLSGPAVAPTGFEDFYRLFRDQVLRYQTSEVGAPTLQLLVHFCSSIAFWLQLDRHQHFGVINLHPRCGFQGLLLLACSALVRSKWTAAEVLETLRRSSIAAQDGGVLERRLRAGAGPGYATHRDGDGASGAGRGRQASGVSAGGWATSRRLAGDRARSGRAKKTWGVICWQDAEDWPPSCRRYLHYFARLVKRGGVEFTVPRSPGRDASADADEAGGNSASPPSPLFLSELQGGGETSPCPSSTPSPSNFGRDRPANKKLGIPSTPYRLKNIIMENFTPPAELVCVEVYEVTLCFGCRCRSTSPHAPSAGPTRSAAPPGAETRLPREGSGAEASAKPRAALEQARLDTESSPAEGCSSPRPPSLSSGGSTTASASLGVQKEGTGVSVGTLLSPRLKLPRNVFKKRGASPGAKAEDEKEQARNEGGNAQSGSSCLASSTGTVTMHSSLYAHPYIKALRQQELLSSRKTGAGTDLPDRVPLLLEPAGPLGHLVSCCVATSAPPVPVSSGEFGRSLERPDATARRKGGPTGENQAGSPGDSDLGLADAASSLQSPAEEAPPRERLTALSGAPETPAAGAEDELGRGALCCPMCCVDRGRYHEGPGAAFPETRPAKRPSAGGALAAGHSPLLSRDVVREQFVLRACVNNYQLMAADTMEGGETSLVFDFSHNRDGDDQYLVLSGDVLFAFRQLAAIPQHSTSPDDAEGPPAKEDTGAGEREKSRVGSLKERAKKMEWGTGQQVFATFSFHTGFMVQGATDVQQLTKEDLDTYDSSHRDLIPDGLRVSLIFEPVRPSLFETGPSVRRPARAVSPSPPDFASATPPASAPGSPTAKSGVVALDERATTSPEAKTTAVGGESVFAPSTCGESQAAFPRSSPPSVQASAVSDAPSDDGKKCTEEHGSGDRTEKGEQERTKRVGPESERGGYGAGTGLGALASWLGFPGGASSRPSAGDLGGPEGDRRRKDGDTGASEKGGGRDKRRDQRTKSAGSSAGRTLREACGAVSPSSKMTHEQRRLLKMMHEQQERHKLRDAERQKATQICRGDADWNQWKNYILWRAQQWVGQPKPDRREFWRRHVGPVEEVQLWRLSKLTGCGRDNCLVALKVCCNDVADALMFLSLYFASTPCPLLVHLFPPLSVPLPPSDPSFRLRQGGLPPSTATDLSGSRPVANASALDPLGAGRPALPGNTVSKDSGETESGPMAVVPLATPPVGSRVPTASAAKPAAAVEAQPASASGDSPRRQRAEGRGSVSDPVASGGASAGELASLATSNASCSEAGSCSQAKVAGDRETGEGSWDSSGETATGVAASARGFPGPFGDGVECSSGEYRTLLPSSRVPAGNASGLGNAFGFGNAGASSAYLRTRAAVGLADHSLGFGIEDAFGSGTSAPSTPTAGGSESGLEPEGTVEPFGGWRRQRRMAPVPQRPGQLKPRQTPSCASTAQQAPRIPTPGASLPSRALVGGMPLPIRRSHTVGGAPELSHLFPGAAPAGLATPASFEEAARGSADVGRGAGPLPDPVGHPGACPSNRTLSSVPGERMFPASAGTAGPGMVSCDAGASGEDRRAVGRAAGEPGGGVALSDNTERGQKEEESPAVQLVGASHEGKEVYTVKLPSGRVVRFSVDQRKVADGQDIVLHASHVTSAPAGGVSGAPTGDGGATAGVMCPAVPGLPGQTDAGGWASPQLEPGGDSSGQSDGASARGKLASADADTAGSSAFDRDLPVPRREEAAPMCRVGVQRAQSGSRQTTGSGDAVPASGLAPQAPAGARGLEPACTTGGAGFPPGGGETAPLQAVGAPAGSGPAFQSGIGVPGPARVGTQDGDGTAKGVGTQGTGAGYEGTVVSPTVPPEGGGLLRGCGLGVGVLAGAPGTQGPEAGSGGAASASSAQAPAIPCGVASTVSRPGSSVDAADAQLPWPSTANADSTPPGSSPPSASAPGASEKAQQTSDVAGAPCGPTTAGSASAGPAVAPKKKAAPPLPGKTSGAPKAPGGPPGKGKAPPLPPKAKKPPMLGKAPKPGAPPKKAEGVDPKTLPLRRKIHWKTLGQEQIEGTVFKELEGDPAIPDMFDPEAISRLFSATLSGKGEEAAAKAAPKKPEEKKHSILDNKRAQNVAIVLARLPLTLDVLAKKLLSLDTEGLNLDILQKAEQAAPTPEELVKFREYEEMKKADPANTPELRDVEKKMTALLPLTRLSSRVRIMQTALQWEKIVEEIEKQLELLCTAADEAHNSRKFRSLLQAVLQWGNYVNHGVKKAPQGQVSCESEARQPDPPASPRGGENRQGLQQLPPVLLVKELPTKGFKLASLTKLMEFKTTIDKSICSLHFIISNLIVSLPELDIADLASDMPSLDAAARVSDEAIDASISFLRNEAAFILSQIHALKQAGTAGRAGGGDAQVDEALHAELTRLQKLHGEMVLAMERLREKYLNCKEVIGEVARFYGEDGPKKPSGGKPKAKGSDVSIDTGAAPTGGVMGEWETGLLDQSPFELLSSILTTCRQGLRDVQANPRKYAILLVGRFASEEEKWRLLKFHIDNSLSNRKRLPDRRDSDADQDTGRPRADGVGCSGASSPRTTPRGSVSSRDGKKLLAARQGPETGAAPRRAPQKSDDGSFRESRRLGRGASGDEEALGTPRSAERNASARGRLGSGASDVRRSAAIRSRSQVGGGKAPGMIARFKSSPFETGIAGDPQAKARRGSVSPHSGEESPSRRWSAASGRERGSTSESLPGARNYAFRTSKSCASLVTKADGKTQAGKTRTGCPAGEWKAAPGRQKGVQALLQRQASQFAAGISASSASGDGSPGDGTSEASPRPEAGGHLALGGDRSPPARGVAAGAAEREDAGDGASGAGAAESSSLPRALSPRQLPLRGKRGAESDTGLGGEDVACRSESRRAQLMSEEAKRQADEGGAASSARENHLARSPSRLETLPRGASPPDHSPRATRGGAVPAGSDGRATRLFSNSAAANPSLSPLDALQPAFSDMALAASINKALFADDMDLESPGGGGTPGPTPTHALFSACGLSLFPNEREGDALAGASAAAPAVSAPHHFPSARSRPATPFPGDGGHLASAEAPAAAMGADRRAQSKGNGLAVRTGPVSFVPSDDSPVFAEATGADPSPQQVGRNASLLSERDFPADARNVAHAGEASAPSGARDEVIQSAQASLSNEATHVGTAGGRTAGPVAPVSSEPASAGANKLQKSQSGPGAVNLLEVKVFPSTPVFCWEGGGVVGHAAGSRAPACQRRPIVCRPRRPPPPIVSKQPLGSSGANAKAPTSAKAPHSSPARPLPPPNEGL